MKEHKIPIPWAVKPKDCTQEQWDIIRKYREEVSYDHSSGSSIIANYNENYAVIKANSFSEQIEEKELSNYKLYTPEEAVKLIEGMSDEELIEEAKRRYPVGTKFKTAHLSDDSNEYCIITEDSKIDLLCGHVYATVNGNGYILPCDDKSQTYGNTGASRILYYKDKQKWAEIIPEEPQGFKKGDYIVTLSGNFNNTSCAKENYVFKQRVAEKSIEPCCDLQGDVENNNLGLTFDKKGNLKDWRYATPEEIAEYDRLGKPYDVTTLTKKPTDKHKFKVGDKVIVHSWHYHNIKHLLPCKAVINHIGTKEPKYKLQCEKQILHEGDTYWFNENEFTLDTSSDTKPKFEVGRWYKWENMVGCYAKYSENQKQSDEFYYDERIFNNNHKYSHGWASINVNPILLEDLSEIQQYLPEGHPDKFPVKDSRKGLNHPFSKTDLHLRLNVLYQEKSGVKDYIDYLHQLELDGYKYVYGQYEKSIKPKNSLDLLEQELKSKIKLLL